MTHIDVDQTYKESYLKWSNELKVIALVYNFDNTKDIHDSINELSEVLLNLSNMYKNESYSVGDITECKEFLYTEFNVLISDLEEVFKEQPSETTQKYINNFNVIRDSFLSK